MSGIIKSSITLKIGFFAILCGVVILYSCKSSEPNAKKSKSELSPKESKYTGPRANRPISSMENENKPSQDSLSYRISRSAKNYPVVHIPLAVDSNATIWKGIDLSPQPPVFPLSAKEQQARFKLKPGYHMNPVITEPNIHQPAAVKFDGDGRMYVLELRSFMRDVDANGETAPISRISRWEDIDNDGIYDHGTAFVDSLIFPRFVLPFGPNSVLAMESNHDNIYKYTDTNGDQKADEKELFATGMGRVGNLEAQTGFLTWAMDNWMYSTRNNVRIRWTPEGVIKEKIGYPEGQWGTTQDNYGKIWSQGGADGVPDYFQFPIEYGNFHVKNELAKGFRVPYSLIQIGDNQSGMGGQKPDGSLAQLTAAAGNTIYRGDRLPEELVGDYFYGGTVARIVRRVKSIKKEGLTYLSNYYQPEKSEFIQSTDPLFRPLDMANAPDGTMYIADMYQGIIQEGTYTPQGGYIRAKIKQYGLDKIFNSGRIWRLTYKDMGRDTTRPHMYEETASQLVQHLKNPNGWWRDKAQHLLILRQDKTVVPALRNMVKHSDNEFARFHALWTLEGLDALKMKMVTKLMKDPDYHIRIQAIRASETLYKNGHKSLINNYKNLTKDSNTNVVIQAMMTLHTLGTTDIDDIVKATKATNSARGVQVVGSQILKQIANKNKIANKNFASEELKLYNKGATIFSTLCSQCHGDNGKGKFVGESGKKMAPALANSNLVQERPEYVVKAVLHGLKGPIKGETYSMNIMAAQKTHSDKWVASVISYVRNSMGNRAPFVTPKYVGKIRKATAKQKENYTYKELMATIPDKLKQQKNWVVTASSSVSASPGLGSSSSPSSAFTLAGWRTKTYQKPGMWFQMDLKKPVNLTRIQFDSPRDMFPKQYTVQVSLDGKDWNSIARGEGENGHTMINFDSVRARYVRLKQTAKGDKPWAMRMLKLYVRQ